MFNSLILQKVSNKIKDFLYSEILGKLREPSYIHPDYFYVGYGMDITDGRYSNLNEGWIYVNMGKKEGNHIILYGKSGSGKSEFLSRKTYEEIMLGKQSFCIDPKGSKSWIESFLKANYRKGYLNNKDELPLILSLPYPSASFKFNPLYGMEPTEIADIISSGVPDSKEPFWKNISFEISLAIAFALKAKGYEEITFRDIYENINITNLQALESKLKSEADPTSDYYESALSTIEQLSKYDSQYFSKVNSSLRTYLTRIITGPVGEIISSGSRNNLLEERLEAGKLRFYAFLGAESLGTVAYDVGRILISWLLKYVGKQSKNLKIIEPQLRANFDEVTELGFAEINKAIRLVRERNVSITMATQSPKGFASSFAKDGDKIVDDIMNSSSAIIYLKMNDQDLDKVASFAGTTMKFKIVVSSSSFNLVAQSGEIIEPNDIRQLEKGMGYCFMNGKTYFFYSPLIKDKIKLEIDWGQEEKIKQPQDKKIKVNLKKIAEMYERNQNESQEVPIEMLIKDIIIVEGDKVLVNVKAIQRVIKSNDNNIKFLNREIEEIYQTEKDSKYIKELFILLKLLDILGRYTKSGSGKSENIDLLTHVINVYNLASNIANREGLEKEEKDLLIVSILGHDVGKIILYNQKGTPVGESREHELVGINIMKDAGFNQDIIDVLEGKNSKIKKLLDEADYEARKKEEEELEKKKEEMKNKLSNSNIIKLYEAIRNEFIDKETKRIKDEYKYDVIYVENDSSLLVSDEVVKKYNLGDSELKIMKELNHIKYNRDFYSSYIYEDTKIKNSKRYIELLLKNIDFEGLNNLEIEKNNVSVKKGRGQTEKVKKGDI